MSTSNQNSEKKSPVLTVEMAKNIVLSIKKEPTQQEILQQISSEVIEQYTNGIKLKSILKALKDSGFNKITLKNLEDLCGIIKTKKQNLSEPVEFASGQIS